MALWLVCKSVLFLVLRVQSLMRSIGLGSVIFGYDLGVIAGVLASKDFAVRSSMNLHYRTTF